VAFPHQGEDEPGGFRKESRQAEEKVGDAMFSSQKSPCYSHGGERERNLMGKTHHRKGRLLGQHGFISREGSREKGRRAREDAPKRQKSIAKKGAAPTGQTDVPLFVSETRVI